MKNCIFLASRAWKTHYHQTKVSASNLATLSYSILPPELFQSFAHQPKTLPWNISTIFVKFLWVFCVGIIVQVWCEKKLNILWFSMSAILVWKVFELFIYVSCLKPMSQNTLNILRFPVWNPRMKRLWFFMFFLVCNPRPKKLWIFYVLLSGILVCNNVEMFMVFLSENIWNFSKLYNSF